jgi:hypothetical protein
MVSEEDNLDYSLESIFSVSSEKAKQLYRPQLIKHFLRAPVAALL